MTRQLETFRRVRLVHREVLDRHVELDVLVERDQPLGDARLLGIVDQRLAALVLLDLAGARRAAFRDRRIRRSAAPRS